MVWCVVMYMVRTGGDVRHERSGTKEGLIYDHNDRGLADVFFDFLEGWNANRTNERSQILLKTVDVDYVNYRDRPLNE